MERYHIYKLGIAILFYAIYCRRPMLVNCADVDDAIGNVNDTSHKISAREYFVYYQGVQGRPGVDFPVFSRIPRTSFSCKEVESGYYADLETDCQVFHICNEGTKVSFLCPNGTIFQQSDLICDWWFKVNCTNSPNLYEESAEQLRESIIRRKASRRVYGNGGSGTSASASFESQERSNERHSGHSNKNHRNNQKNHHSATVTERREQVNFNNIQSQSQQGPLRANNYNNLNNNFNQNVNENSAVAKDSKTSKKVDESTDARQGRNRHVFAVEDSRSEEETQIPQESASFVRDYNKKATRNPYPNHRETYSDIQDPKTYYTNTPANQNTLNNGRPFVVSTPKIGTYTTEKATFNYSPTVPSVRKNNYITPLPSLTTTKKYMSTYGERIRLANMIANKSPNPVPKSYSNVETFTSPPSITDGKSTTPRKPKTKGGSNSFTIGLNSAQGSVAIRTQGVSGNSVKSPALTQSAPSKDNRTKNKGIIKLNLSSGGPAKAISTKQDVRPQAQKPKVRLDLGDLEVPKLKLSSDNEISSPTNRPANPSNGFYVTKSTFRPGQYATSDFNAGSITGSKNTYIPTTISPVTTTFTYPESETTTFTYISNTFGFVKPTGVPKPKPFELSIPTTPRTRTTTEDYYVEGTNLPNYQISSASPFTNVPPTLPSIYNGKSYVGSTPNSFTNEVEKKPLPENVGNMLQTLQEIANVRFAKNENIFDQSGNNPDGLDSDKRPGLVVPPSVGPQTLHTLAVYFANALDSLVEEANSTGGTEAQTNQPITDVPPSHNHPQDNTLISSLLSQDTVNKYKELFMIMAQREMKDEAGQEDDDQDDLQREHSTNAVQSPRVRQLAKVFSQALSSYLDDPENFKKVLHQVRPTEPPPINTLGTGAETLNNEEDELLNFSDADIKPENPRLPTLAPPNPTWGYILAYNTSVATSTDYKSNHIDQNDENLQSADSQSFIPAFNEINSNRLDKSLKPAGLPNNHWTSSPDVTKLWQSTLYVNPFQINQNFDATESLIATSTEETEEFDDDSTQGTMVTHDDSINQPVDVTEYNTERYIDYELRSLPKFNLNSTAVHGLLIDFMNSSKYDENGRLQRILRKLNTTEDEFLTKMKEIEKNPLTKRLILLLVSECGNSTDARTHAVRDIINLANHQGDQGQRHQRQQHAEIALQEQNKRASRYQYANRIPNQANRQPVENSSLRKLVDPSLKDDDQDSRAIQLLNSLYSIASKYGK